MKKRLCLFNDDYIVVFRLDSKGRAEVQPIAQPTKVGDVFHCKVHDDEEGRWVPTTITYLGKGKLSATDEDGLRFDVSIDELLEPAYIRF